LFAGARVNPRLLISTSGNAPSRCVNHSRNARTYPTKARAAPPTQWVQNVRGTTNSLLRRIDQRSRMCVYIASSSIDAPVWRIWGPMHLVERQLPPLQTPLVSGSLRMPCRNDGCSPAREWSVNGFAVCSLVTRADDNTMKVPGCRITSRL